MVGILGGYGDIGIETVKILKEFGEKKLRIGGRSINNLTDEMKAFFKDDELVYTDIEDVDRLHQFVKGCKVIINCTGISTRLIIEVMLELGVDYIDAAVIENKDKLSVNNQSVIDHAGSIPGLSGLLPRCLNNAFSSTDSMTLYYGALGIFTKTAAKDYLDGVMGGDNQSMVVWKNGKVSPYKEKSRTLTLPLSNEPLQIFPYFDFESEIIAKDLDLNNGQWFMALEGNQTLNVLKKARVAYANNKEEVIEELALSTQVDCGGRDTYGGLIVEMSGFVNDRHITKTLVLKCNSPSRLTACGLGVTAKMAIDGNLSKGIYSLCQCQEVEAFMKRLMSLESYVDFNIYEGAIEELFVEEEGEI